MRFTVTPEAVSRLDLAPELADREFDGPPIDEGLVAGFMIGELRWIKKQLKLSAIEQLDAIEARIVYYVLTIRRADGESHKLLPIDRFEKLSARDFHLSAHAASGADLDGDCSECNQPLDAPVHIQPEDGGPGPVPTDPPVRRKRAAPTP